MHTITVTNLNNSGDGSLRQAIVFANAYTGTDEIQILIDESLAGQTIMLSSALPIINKACSLMAPAAGIILTGGLTVYANLHMENIILPSMVINQAVSGSEVVFTGSGLVIDLTNVDVSLANLRATATQEDAYIGINDSELTGKITLGVLGEGLDTYKIVYYRNSIRGLRIESGAELTLEDGVILECPDRDRYLSVSEGGKLVAGKAFIQLGEAAMNIKGEAELTGTTIDSATTEPVRIETGGKLTMSGCDVSGCQAVRVDGGGTLMLKDMSVRKVFSDGAVIFRSTTITEQLIISGGAVSCSEVVFTGSGRVIELTNVDVSLANLRATATQEDTYIGINDSELTGKITLGVLGEGLDTYKIEYYRHSIRGLRIESGAELTLEDGVILECPDRDRSLSVSEGGTLVAGKAFIQLGEAAMNIKGEAELTGTTIDSATTEPVRIENGGKLTMSGCDVSGCQAVRVDGGGTLMLKDMSVRKVSSYGDVIFRSTTITEQLIISGGAVSCSEVVFTGSGRVIELTNVDVSLANLRATATQEDAYIGINDRNLTGKITLCVLGEGLDTYKMEYSWNGNSGLGIESGAELVLEDGVILESPQGGRDLSIKNGGKLVAGKALIQLGESLMSVYGEAELTGTTIDSATTEPVRIENGGKLTMSGCDVSGCQTVRVDGGGTLMLKDMSVRKVSSYGAVIFRSTTITERLIISGGTVSGSEVVFTGSGRVIELTNVDVSLANLRATATQEDAYIGINDRNLTGKITLGVLGEGLDTYKIEYSWNGISGLGIESGAELVLEDGVILESPQGGRDLSIKNGGKLVAGKALIQLGESLMSVYGEAELTGTTIDSATTEPVRIENGGKLTMSGCDVSGCQEVRVAVGGTLMLKDMSVRKVSSYGAVIFRSTTITEQLIISGGVVSGSEVVFTGSGRVIELTNVDVSLANLRATATQEDAYIGINDRNLTGKITLGVLGEGLDTYKIEYSWNGNSGLGIESGAELVLEDGVILESPQSSRDLSIKNGGKLVAGKALIQLGESKMTVYGEAELTGTTIDSATTEPVRIENGGKLTMSGCDVSGCQTVRVAIGGTLMLKDMSVRKVSSYGAVIFRSTTITEQLIISGGAVSCSEVVFTGSGRVIELTNVDVSLANLRATATQEDAYIGINYRALTGKITLGVLGEGLDTYKIEYSWNGISGLGIESGAELVLEDGVILESPQGGRDLSIKNGGKLVAGKALIQLGESKMTVYGEAELTGTTIVSTNSYPVQVYNGGKLTMSGCDVSACQRIQVYAKAEVNVDGCAFGSTIISLAATSSSIITGSDLSEATITISGTPGENILIDLSGNYWGTTDMDAIWARISGDKSCVVINDIALVNPVTEFIYKENSLRNNGITASSCQFEVELSHEIDAATVTDGTVRVLDAMGNDVSVRIVAVEGKCITIEVSGVEHAAEYRLVLADSICDVTGARLKALSELEYTAALHADFVAPRVSQISPSGDFAGTLETLRLYFTDAVDVSTLKNGVELKSPEGQRIDIVRVTDIGGNVYELTISPQTAYGQYSLTVGTGVMDMAGNCLNQNGNDVFGESEDAYVATFNITEVDLTVRDVQVAHEIVLGEKVSIDWNGANASGYALHGSWTDGVYLSTDNRWDINDILLGEYAHTGGLAEGETYSGLISAAVSGVLPGEYYLLVRSDSKGQEQTNKESADVAQNLVAVPITVAVNRLAVGSGEPHIGNLLKGDQQDILLLHQEAGQSLRLTLDCFEDLANLEIFIGDGRVPTRESYDMSWQKGTNKGEILISGGTANRELYILVNNKSTALEVEYGLQADVVPMSVSGITPTTQGQNSATTFDISGVNFTQESKVVLVDAAGQEYEPDMLEVISSGRIRIKYDAKRLPAEKLDVVVRSGDEEVRCDDAITITASTGAHLKIASFLPNVLGYHIMSTIKLLYENTGTDAMHAPLLTYTGKQNGKEGAIMTMDFSIVNQGFWTDAMPEGFSNSVSFLAYSPGTPGWLMPTGRDKAVADGLKDAVSSLEDWLWYHKSSNKVMEGPGYQVSIVNDPEVLSKEPESKYYFAAAAGRGGGKVGSRAWLIGSGTLDYLNSESYYSQYLGNTANIYYCGWQQPWDFSYPPFDFQIGYLGTDNTTALNWYDSFSYTDMPAELKSALANSLTRSAGDTWGDYVLMLNQNLIYLDELGCVSAGANTMFDTDSLVEFELMKANGTMTPTKVLASSTDMSVATTGLSLGISRVYMNNISSRFVDGDFGYGWSHNWDVKLSFREDGTVVYAAAGVQRVYQPSYQGGYINASGDYSSLVKNRDGSYTITERDGMVSKYDREGKLISLRDTNGNTISCTYDEVGKLVKLTHSNGEYIAIEWGGDGHIAALTNKLGDTVSYEYEGGNLLSAQNSLGDKVLYSYSSEFSHALTQIVGADGASLQYTYNSSGLLEDSSATSDDGGITGYGKVSLSYGDNGEVTVTDFYGSTSTYYYDNKGLVRKAVDVNGNTIRYGYDDRGNMTWCTDQSGNTSSWTYDAYGNLTSATNALGYTTRYTYTAQNDIDILTDALGRSTDYDYDAAGNLTSIAYADGSMETWTYDAVGNADSWTNRRGKTVKSSHDAAGRVTLRQYEDGSIERFTYDERGNLLSAMDATGTTTYTYDERYRLTGIQFSSGHSLSYGYDSADRRVSMTDELGNKTCYAYDGFGNLTRVTDAGGNIIAEYSYDMGGRLTMDEKGDGTQTLYSYNMSGAVLEMNTLNAEGELVSFCHYEYDKVGMRTSMTTQDGCWSYTYDKIGQLTKAVFTPSAGSSLATQVLEYEYDAAGNRTRSVVNGVEIIYTVNNMNQTTTAGDVSYTYDADGNMTSKTDSSGTTLYTWDDNNQLIRVQMATGEVYEYAYNAEGDRVSVTENGKVTQYVYDPSGYGNLVAEYDAASGQQEKTYTHGNGLIGFEDAMSGEYFWYQGDALGSVTGITDATGNLVATYAYDPFGSVLGSSGCIENPYQWTGLWGLSQEDTGLTHMRARYYDAETGKFISADPIGVNGGVNLYAYCLNNGVMAVDPSGWGDFGYYGSSVAFGNNKGLHHAYYRFDDGSTIGYGPEFSNYLNPVRLHPVGRGIADAIGSGKFLDSDPIADKIGKPRGGNYDDRIMRKAADEVMKDPRWKNYSLWNNNCQDFTNQLEMKYWQLWLSEHQPSTTLDTGNTGNANSHDPNDMLGPIGYGEQNYIAPGMEMPFMIRFENEEKATAATHWMRVFTTFDEAYDLNSFTLDSFYVAGNLVELTAGQDSFNNKVTMTVDGKEVLVDVKINLDHETRELKAEFMAIDPETGFMIQDPQLGMLYPNNDSGRGDGYITYTISTKDDLPTGTAIGNVADIYFDFNDVIPTPEVNYTIDAEGPESHMLSAEDQGHGGEVLLTWEGADAAGGSGVSGYYIYVQRDGGEFTLWKSFTADTTSATFAGKRGTEYGFYVIATDNVGNVEEAKDAAEITAIPTSTDTTAPDKVGSLMAVSQGEYAIYAWQAVDDPSGVSYVVEYADNAGMADAVQVSTAAPYLVVAEQEFGTWYWRVMAIDGEGNATEWTDGTPFIHASADPLADNEASAATPLITGASAIGTTTNVAPIYDWVGYGDAQDYYTFTAAGDGSYRVNINTATLETAVRVSVGALDAQGEFVAAEELLLAPGAALGTLPGVSVAKGEQLYVKVEALGGENAEVGGFYELSLNGTVPSVGSNLATQNNSAAEATELSSPSAAVSGWVGAGDACDFYRVEMASAGSLSVVLSELESSARLRIYSERADGSLAQLDSRLVKGGSELEHTLSLNDGTYYLEIAAADGGLGACNTSYSLTLEKEEGSDDEFTRNNTIA